MFSAIDPIGPFPSLAPALDGLPWDDLQLDPAASSQWEVRAHWALYVENYLEGLHIPFGALVIMRPMPPVLMQKPKFSTRGVPGLFIGWDLQPGCYWSGDYVLVEVSSFKPGAPKQTRLHRVKQRELLIPEGEWQFPLKAAADRALLDISKRDHEPGEITDMEFKSCEETASASAR